MLTSLAALLTLIQPPSVVLFVVDDLGWRDVSCAGSTWYVTPNVDRVAREGVRFTQAYAAAAVCSPSRSALMTGRAPARLGITDWIHHASSEVATQVDSGRPATGYTIESDEGWSLPINVGFLPLEELTLAELLAESGHVSAHVGKWHLGPEGWLPTEQGFAENHGGWQFGQPPSFFDPFANRRFDGIPTLPGRTKGEYLTDREADEAVAFVRRHADRPFFLHLSFYAVHAPLQAPEAAIDACRERPEEGRQGPPVYAAMVERVDAAVGRVLAALDDLDLADRTIVVFTSDNGGASHFPATDNAPLRAGKGFPYEGGLRVPLIVRWPGVARPGVTSDVPVIGHDLLPTIAAGCGASLPLDVQIDGVNLEPLLTGDGELERDALVWHFPHTWWGGRIRPYSVLRKGDRKLIRHWESGQRELYDLGEDPGERNDVAAERPDEAAELDAELSRRLTALGARLPRRSSESSRQEPEK